MAGGRRFVAVWASARSMWRTTGCGALGAGSVNGSSGGFAGLEIADTEQDGNAGGGKLGCNFKADAFISAGDESNARAVF